MALYAIGDLHLHFQTELKVKTQMKDRIWKNHELKFQKNCFEMIQQEDTLVLVGDHSFGRNLKECEADMEYIAALPGRKILIRGNHDMFWDAKKTNLLNAHYIEGPFYLDRRGRILGWDEKKEEQSIKLVEREIERLIRSFEDARAAGFRKYLMFLHYPPTNILEDDSPFTKIAEQYGAEQIIYAHSHGESRFHDSIQGEKNGILYSLVSGDYLKWKPKRIL